MDNIELKQLKDHIQFGSPISFDKDEKILELIDSCNIKKPSANPLHDAMCQFPTEDFLDDIASRVKNKKIKEELSEIQDEIFRQSEYGMQLIKEFMDDYEI